MAVFDLKGLAETAKDPNIMLVISLVIFVIAAAQHFLGVDLLLATGVGLFVVSTSWIAIRKFNERQSRKAEFDFSQHDEAMRKAREAIEQSKKADR